MKRVSFVFATGLTWLDRLVTRVTKSPWSHVALRFDSDNILVEALAGTGFIIQEGGKYSDWPVSRSISLEISEADYENMLQLSLSWNADGIAYGYKTCLLIGIKEVFGPPVAKACLKVFPGLDSNKMVCSEMIVNLWRQANPEFLSGRDPRLVSPDELYQVLIALSPLDSRDTDFRDKIDKPRDCAYNC